MTQSSTGITSEGHLMRVPSISSWKMSKRRSCKGPTLGSPSRHDATSVWKGFQRISNKSTMVYFRSGWPSPRSLRAARTERRPYGKDPRMFRSGSMRLLRTSQNFTPDKDPSVEPLASIPSDHKRPNNAMMSNFRIAETRPKHHSRASELPPRTSNGYRPRIERPTIGKT